MIQEVPGLNSCYR